MIESHTLFVDKMWSAKMPNHEVFKKQVEDIMTIEKNKDIHQFSTEPERECNVKAIRTSWRSHHEYPPIRDITEEIKIFLHEVIQKEKYKINKIMTLEAWANLYRKNDHAIPHHHGKGVIACVYFVSIPKDSKSRFLLYNKNFNAMSEKDENKEEVKDMILNDRGSLAGAMIEDGEGAWTWGEISEIKKENENER